mmetsp:Transcript_73626/g.204659  ORF Transcript_73626/g.204659 Transcript_73626/m.204659 type:complete len:200 (-) Transcript_73626:52-651(-)
MTTDFAIVPPLAAAEPAMVSSLSQAGAPWQATLPVAGRVRVLKELTRANVGESVRVTGEVEHLEPAGLLLGARGVRLWVDTSAATVLQMPVGRGFGHAWRNGSLLQVIGEIEACGSDATERTVATEAEADSRGSASLLPTTSHVLPLQLRARVARLVDALDMSVYETCLEVRRDFESRYCPEDSREEGAASETESRRVF